MIEKIKWNSKMKIGVKSIDKQHRQLIDITNKLIEDSSNDNVSETINEMVEYSNSHFKHEEKLMKEFGYPELEDQQSSHREFIAKTVEFCTESMRNMEIAPSSVIIFLKEWLVDHILREDQKLKVFFADKKVR